MILGANSGGLLVSPMSDWFEDHKAMDQRRRERAKGEPIVEVTGIIPPTGVAEGLWSLGSFDYSKRRSAAACPLDRSAPSRLAQS
jgi:hypothetical protein